MNRVIVYVTSNTNDYSVLFEQHWCTQYEQHCYTTHGDAVPCSVCMHVPRLLTGFGSDEQVIS